MATLPTHPDQVTDNYRFEHMPPHFASTLRYFTNARGNRIAGYFWPSRQLTTKGIVLLVHGHGSHLCYEYLKFQGPQQVKTYEGSWVEALNDAGYSVAGIDAEGLGRSQGLFGYLERFQHAVDNILQFSGLLPALGGARFSSDLPLFVLGFSLGGCLALSTALREQQRFAGVVLLAPMLSLEKVKSRGANRVLNPIASLLSIVIPTWPIATTNKNTMFPDYQEDWDTSPETFHYPVRVRTATEYLAGVGEVGRRMPEVTLPFIAFHSTKDTMTDPDGSRMLYDMAKSADKTLHLVDDMWHLLSKEPGNERILAMVLQWLAERVPSPPPAAAVSA